MLSDLELRDVGFGFRLGTAPLILEPFVYQWFRDLGRHLHRFYGAINDLYLASAEGRQPRWIADYLDNGKPATLVEYGRLRKFRSLLPVLIRPDVIPTPDGMMICELDSVPGGFGLIARLSRFYEEHGACLAQDIGIEDGFMAAMRTATGAAEPAVAIVVSEESADYRPEMAWLAQRLQAAKHQVFCVGPDDLVFADGRVFVDGGEGRIPVDVVYRFMELYDLPNVPQSESLLQSAESRSIALTPPIKPQLEEKVWFALLHHPLLCNYWAHHLGRDTFELLKRAMPPTWIVDPATPPPAPGSSTESRAAWSWAEVCAASKSNRRLVLKPSGFSSLSWGSRGVVIGHDCSSQAWATAINKALIEFPRTTSVLQHFRSGARVNTTFHASHGGSVVELEGRVRLTPYYFNIDGQFRLSSIMATICPLDKKKLHGMRDAVIVPCALAEAASPVDSDP